MSHVAPWAAAALIAGAAGGICLDLPPWIWLTALAAGWIVAGAGFVLRHPRVLLGAVLFGCAGAGGALGDRDARLALAPPIARHAATLGDAPVRLEGRLRDDAELTDFGAAITIDATRIWIAGKPTPTAGGVRLAVAGTLAVDARDRWRSGRLLRVTTTLRRPQAYRNFGTPDQEARTALRGIRLFGTVKSATLIEVLGRGPLWREAAAEARARVRRSIDAAVGVRDRGAAAIVVAVLIGDRGALDPRVEARLQRAGTFHVIAISGGNIAILVGAMLWTLRLAGRPPRSQAALALGGLAVYAVIVAAGSSVARATLAASLYLVARVLDHRGGAWAIVATTAGALVVARPLLVLDAGFWLTFVASLAILEHGSAIADRLARLCRLDAGRMPLSRAPITLLAATMAAEGSLAPITAFVFSQVTAAGLVLNFAAVPLMTIVQMAGIAVVACASIHPALATPPALVAAMAARGITESARAVDLATWTAPRVPPPPLWLVVIGVAAWWTSWSPRAGRVKPVAAALWVGVMAAIVAGCPLRNGTASWLPQRLAPCAEPALPDGADGDRWLRVIFFDVGQGSSTLVRFPGSAAMLIDAGGAAASRFDVGARVVSPALWALGVRRLSAAVLTHGDVDHIGGAAAVVDAFAPREIWEGVPVPSNALLRDLSVRAASNRLRWMRMTRGASRNYDGVTARIRHPPAPDWERPRARNDDSIVMELQYGDVSIVLPGDIGSEVERAIAPDFATARLRVLSAAHHGSRLSTSDVFLDALSPRVAILSAGRDNRHGHPSAEVLDRLARRGIRTLRTDRDGAIALDTDGHTLRLTTCVGATSGDPGARAPGLQTVK